LLDAAVEAAKRAAEAAEQREKELQALQDELARVASDRDQLSVRAQAAKSQAERRLAEVEGLQDSLKDQSTLLMSAQKQEMEALQRAAEQEAQLAPLQHALERLRAELAGSKQHTEWLESQLTDKTAAVQELRQTTAKSTHEHEEMKERLTDELASAKRQLESARAAAKKTESTLIHNKEQLKELMATKVHAEEQFQSELSAQRRLADLYKQSTADANARVSDLQELCESLRTSLADAEKALSLETERSKEQVEHLFREQAEASERRVEALQEELRAAQDRVTELEKKKLQALETAVSIGDLSSAAGEAHLAAHGLTPKQMLDHIVELEKTLQEERGEKEKLQLYMDRIVKEVQEKTPIIMRLRIDHERAISSQTQLSERLEICMQELSKSKSNEKQARKEKQTYEKKCESLAQSVDDLSRQVQHLLFKSQEQQQQRHLAIPGEVASESLVVFKDVEELQMRNQQLLTVIRELTEMTKRQRHGDDDESDVGSESGSAHLIISAESDDEQSTETVTSSSVKHRLAVARKELEQLRTEREQEREMITAIVKQRDMYRVLLAQSDRQFADGDTSTSRSGAGGMRFSEGGISTDATDMRKLRDLQREFDDYKKEKQTNMKILQESLEHARADCSQFKVAQMQAQVEAAHHKERFEAADARYEDAEKEIVRLRAKTDQLSALMLQHQQMLGESEAKLEAATSQLQTLRIEKEGAVREVEFLRKHDEKLQQEMMTLRLDNTNLLKLMESNRKIDAAREQHDYHEIEAQKRKVATLEAKMHELYDKLDTKEAMSSASLIAADKEKQTAVKELETLRQTYTTIKEQVVRLETQKTSLEEKLAIFEKENAHLHEQLRKGASATATERVATLEMQLRDAQREVQTSLVARKSLAETATKSKAIAEANEKSLTELSSASEQWKKAEHEKLQTMEKQRDQIQAELRKARDELKEHITEGNQLREEMDRLEVAHKQALQQATEQQKLMEVQANGAKQELAVVREELEKTKVDLGRVQENYERELQLHAEEVSKASATRRQIESERKLRVEKEQAAAALEAKVRALEKEAQTQLDALQKRLEEAADAKSAILEQNQLLHSQLERAAVQVRRSHEEMLKKAADKPSGSAGDAGNNDAHDKEVDELRSVIAFLRRESEIASSKLELAQQEAQRHRAQIFELESTIDRLREEIKGLNVAAAGSSTDAASSSETAAGSAEEKRASQLEQLSLLRESNATLRDENQKNLARLQEEEAKRKKLEAQLAPLQTSETALKTLVDSLKQEIVTLNDANKRWKQRVEQLVEKYQQVDPAEFDAVKAERDTLKKEVSDIQTQLTTLQTELETLRSSGDKALEEERNKAENWSKQYDRIKGFAKNWKNKAEALTKQLAEKNKESEDRAVALSALETQVSTLTTEKTAIEAKLATSEASKNDSAAAASGAVATWEKERQDLQVRLDAEAKKTTQLKDFNTRLMQGLKSLKKENSELKDQAQAMAAAPAPAAPSAPPAGAQTSEAAPKTHVEPPKPVSIAPAATGVATSGNGAVAVTQSLSVPAPPLPPASTTTTPASTPQESVAKTAVVASSASSTTTTATTSTAMPVPSAVSSGVPAATAASVAASAPTKAPTPFTAMTKAPTPFTAATKAPTTFTAATKAPTPFASTTKAPTPFTAVAPSVSVTPAMVPPAAAKPSPPLPPTPAPVATTTTATTTPASSPSTAKPEQPAAALSAEEQLRMFALKSMMKKHVGGAARLIGTPTKTTASTVVAPAKSPPRPSPPPLQLEPKVRSSVELAEGMTDLICC
jgi:nucleoprotein TPR